MTVYFKDARGGVLRQAIWQGAGFSQFDRNNFTSCDRAFFLIHANDLPSEFCPPTAAAAAGKLPAYEADLRTLAGTVAILYFSGGGNPLNILRPYGAAERQGVHFYMGRTDQVVDAFAEKVKELAGAWPAGQPEPEWKRLGSWLNEARVFAGEQILAQAAGLAPSANGAVAHPFDVNGIKWGESQNLLGDWLKAAKAVQAAMSDPDRRGLENACGEFLKVTS